VTILLNLAAPPGGFTLSPDSLVTGGISLALGLLAFFNSLRARQEHAAAEGRAANAAAFDQAQRFYQDTNQALTARLAQLGEENTTLNRQNRTLSRQLDRFERLIHELNIVLPDNWQQE